MHSNMNRSRDYYTKWSQLDKNIIWYHLFAKSKKILKNELFLKENELFVKEKHTNIEKQTVVTEGKREGLWLFSC